MAELPAEASLKAVVTIQKGSVEQRSRGGDRRNSNFTVLEGYDVLKAKVDRILNEDDFSQLRRDDERIYFRRSKGASQHQFDVLGAGNFSSLLQYRWKRISTADRRLYGENILDQFEFEFFVYCHPIATRSPQSIHRATAARIRLASERVRQYERESDVNLGPITLNHVTTSLARQPDITAFTMPSDNTTRQAIALDQAISDAQQEQDAGVAARVAPIRLRVNGSWVTYEADVLALRAALGLPQHDIFTQGIYHGFQPVPAPEIDVPDTDHDDTETTATEQKFVYSSSTLASSSNGNALRPPI